MSRDYFEEGARVGVLTPEPLDRVLDYRAPEGGCWLGAFVEVPLGPRKVLGVIWGEGAGDFDATKLRQVNRVLEAAPMRAAFSPMTTCSISGVCRAGSRSGWAQASISPNRSSGQTWLAWAQWSSSSLPIRSGSAACWTVLCRARSIRRRWAVVSSQASG